MTTGTNDGWTTDRAEDDPAPLLGSFVRAIESDPSIDGRSAMLDRVATPLTRSRLGPVLLGQQVGHAIHPFLTDLPLGCWTSAMILDLVGGRNCRVAARRLTGIGLLGVVPTVLSGLAEYDSIDEQPTRRVATVHAAANSVAAGCQLLSWRSRRKDRYLRGVLWGLAGNSAAAASGYLGGHMAFARQAGDGLRAADVDRRPAAATDDLMARRAAPELLDDVEAARLLGVREDRLDELVAQGVLEPANAEEPGARWFRRVDVAAVSLVGG